MPWGEHRLLGGFADSNMGKLRSKTVKCSGCLFIGSTDENMEKVLKIVNEDQ
jgi:hypothetical protein